MDLQESLFLIQLLAILAIAGMKLFNIFREGERFNIAFSWLMFGGALMFYGLGLIVYLNNITKLIFSGIFAFERLLILLCVIFMAIEQILYIKTTSITAFKSLGSTRRG